MKLNFLKKIDSIRIILLGLGMILGLSFILYPFFSQLYYDYYFSIEVDDFQKDIENSNFQGSKRENIKLAESYNEALEPNLRWSDPYTEKERRDGIKTYAKMLEVKEKVGVLYIPKINLSLPVYAGTNETILQKGAGHLEGTSLPVGGKNTHTVLTAHRGLPKSRLFTDLDKLDLNDIFYVETIAGELFYKVDKIQIVKPDETEAIKIIEDKDYVTLLTCTPYMINSHRLLVRGIRIPNPSEKVKDILEEEKDLSYYWLTYKYYALLIFIIVIIYSIVIFKYRNV